MDYYMKINTRNKANVAEDTLLILTSWMDKTKIKIFKATFPAAAAAVAAGAAAQFLGRKKTSCDLLSFFLFSVHRLVLTCFAVRPSGGAPRWPAKPGPITSEEEGVVWWWGARSFLNVITDAWLILTHQSNGAGSLCLLETLLQLLPRLDAEES